MSSPEQTSGARRLFVARMVHTTSAIGDDIGAAHWHWVQGRYDTGIFVASGPSDGGGVALAGGCDRAELEMLLSTDPVIVAGMGRYEVTEFVVSRSSPAFGEVLAELTARRSELTRRLE